MQKLFLYVALLVPFVSKGNTIIVGKKYIATIKEAIAQSRDGDTILVEKNIYKEGNIIIDRSITIIGKEWPVLDGQRKYEVLSVKANNVTVSGFKVQKSGYATMDDPGAIKIYDARNVTISDNIIHDNFFGIYLQYCKNCIVKNNKITAFGKDEHQIGNGIHCWKSDSLLIIHNQISGHRDGIYFEFVTYSTIWRNTAFNNIRYGLHFMFSNNDAYYTNVFRGNGAGVAVMFTKHVVMCNNKFEQNWGDAAYGLLLKEISDCVLIGNKFYKNTAAIFMDGSNRMDIAKNDLINNGWALKIQANCMENNIKENNFLSNTFDVGTNGSLTLNIFENNYWDKYEGYDLNKDNIGDVPFRPLSLYSVIVENNPSAMLLYRSFMISLLDKSEKVIPSLTPENFIDNRPLMHALYL